MIRVSIEHASVSFPVFNVNAKSLVNKVMHRAVGSQVTARNEVVYVDALKEIQLSFQPGDRVGLIGHNGAGKSTLLKLIAQIYEPTVGRVETVGSIGSLFDLTSGMNTEATAEENVYLRGMLLGKSKKEIKENIGAVIEFTELAEYFYMPIRTYSSGMLVRLAFSLATVEAPDILLVDEVFGAGDQAFVQKAKKRMTDLFEASHIVVFASHNIDLLKQFCNKAVWLDNGAVRAYGDIASTVEQYLGRAVSAP